MKRFTLLKTMLLLCALIVGSGNLWAGDVTCTLTGASMLEGNSPSTSYADHTTGIIDNRGFTYTGRWTYQKSNKVYLNMIQMKAVESSNSSRILLPTFDGPIKSITITATSTSATESTGDGVTSNLAIVKGTTYTSSYATNATNQVLKIAPSSATNTYLFDFTSLDKSYDGTNLYVCITSGSGIRIWSIVVVYSEADYYNVTYKYNDGVTADKVVQVAKASASSYTLDTNPSRTDFSFEGWNDGTNTYDGGAAYTITKGVTFTAQWAFTGTPTVYNKSNKNDIATGAQYIMTGVNSGVWAYASGISGSNTFIDASTFEPYSTVDATSASMTCESPLVLTLEETANGWYLKDAGGNKLGLNGDKKVKWNDGDMTWTLGGTSDVPTFTAIYDSNNYTIEYNPGSTRFTGYKSGQQDVYFYRLDDGKDVYTLLLDYNDGATDDAEHRVLEGASYTLTTPTRSGYVFTGWNTEENGSGTNYPAGAYTMPDDDTILYAQWIDNVSVSISSAGWATYCSEYALDFTDVTGLTAYTASVDGPAVKFTKVTGKVPANTGLLVGGTTTNVPVCASADPVENLLEGVTEETVKDAESIYVLMKGDKGLGFYKNTNAFTVRANSAYLPATSVPGAASRSFISFDDETTGIEAINSNPETVKENAREYYNLNGQRVTTPTKGLYIVNGKKVVIK